MGPPWTEKITSISLLEIFRVLIGPHAEEARSRDPNPCSASAARLTWTLVNEMHIRPHHPPGTVFKKYG
jgi:hypothetical protein